MQFKKLPVDQLRPAPYNPRIRLRPGEPAWEKLARSLEEFDLVQPIVWNERTGHVVAGHQRLEVLQHRGLTEVDCVVVNLPLEKEQALNITLNNASVASDWDPGRLVELVTRLQELPDFDATLTGFDEQQLKDLVLSPALDIEIAPDDAADEEDPLLHVMLDVPPDDWDGVRGALDALLAEYPMLRLHVRHGL